MTLLFFSQLDITNDSQTSDIGVFTQNGEWEFIGFPNQRHIVYYSCCLEPFSDITFYLIIRRKPLYYVFNLILPCIFITAVTLLVFYLPAESGEKVMMRFKYVNITVVNYGTTRGIFWSTFSGKNDLKFILLKISLTIVQYPSFISQIICQTATSIL